MTELSILPAEQFDYTTLDAETRIVVQQRTSEIKTVARRAATDIIEIGQKLIEVKERLEHGKFETWLRAEFGWSQPSAWRFMQVAQKFQNIQIEGFAPSALYLLSSGNVPDEARAEAVRYAEAGERITVAKAQAIVMEYKPAGETPFATAEQLQAAVRSWLVTRWAGNAAAQRTGLQQIALGNSYGLDHLNALAEYARKAGLRVLLADLKKAAAAVAAEFVAEAPVKVTYRPTGAPADLLEVGPNGPGVRSDAEVDAEAKALEPRVWAFMTLSLPPRVAELEEARRLTGSLLDLEGFHARRGRNFDWEALVGRVGAQVDHEALRRAVRTVRERVLQMLAEVANAGSVGDRPEQREQSERKEDVAVEEETPVANVVGQWLQEMAEENEIPRQRGGVPEPEAVKIMLTNMLADRSNGGGVAWRALRQHPAWPAGTPDADKLAAVRSYLTAMPVRPPLPAYARPLPPMTPFAEPRPLSVEERLLQRKNQQIYDMAVAIDKALGYLKSLAAHQDEPDEDLIECIAALEEARNLHQD